MKKSITYTELELTVKGKSTLIAITRYAHNDAIAILLVTKDLEPFMHVTINREGYNISFDTYAWIKSYSENEGVLRALHNAGLVKPIMSEVINQFGTLAHFCELTGPLADEIHLLIVEELFLTAEEQANA